MPRRVCGGGKACQVAGDAAAQSHEQIPREIWFCARTSRILRWVSPFLEASPGGNT